MPIKAVSFDVFDTLVANNPAIWLESFEALCAQQGLPIEPLALWEPWHALERGFRLDRLDRATMTPARPFETYQHAWARCFRQVFDNMGLQGDPEAASRLCLRDLGRRPSFPETHAVLRLLHGRLPLAIVSNADRGFLYPLIEHRELGAYFGVVVCSEDVEAYKPHNSPFERMLERLGLAPEEVLHVGDKQEEDVWGPNRLGIRSAWLNRPGAPPDPGLPGPDYELRSLEDLLTVLDEDGVGAAPVHRASGQSHQ